MSLTVGKISYSLDRRWSNFGGNRRWVLGLYREGMATVRGLIKKRGSKTQGRFINKP